MIMDAALRHEMHAVRDTRRERLARKGALRLGTGKLPRSLFKLPRGGAKPSGVLAALLAERDEGR